MDLYARVLFIAAVAIALVVIVFSVIALWG